MSVDLNAAAAVIARTFDLPILRQIQEASVLFSELNTRPYFGKDCTWRVSGTGRTVSKVASGADAPSATHNVKKDCKLDWGRYATTVQIGFDAITAALQAPSGPTGSGIVDLVQTEMADSLRALGKEINKDLYGGTGANSIIGLNTAIAGAGAYAGLDPATDSWWASYDSGTSAALTLPLLDTAMDEVGNNYGSNLVPGRDILVSRGDLRMKVSQLEAASGNKNHMVATSPGEQDGRVVIAGGRTSVWYDGCRVIKDTDCQANRMYLLRKPETWVRFMPFTIPGTNDVVTRPLVAGEMTEDSINNQMPVMVHVIPLARTGDHVKFEVLVQLQLVVRSRFAHGRGNWTA